MAPFSTTGATRMSRPHRYSSPRATATRIVRIVQPQRADDRQAGVVRLADGAVEVRHQRDSAARDTSGRSARPRRCAARSDPDWPRRPCSSTISSGSSVAGVPAPRQAQLPRAAVRAKQRTERAELKPADVELAGELLRRHEAADVGAPERNARQPGVDRDRHVRLQRLPRRVDIARPEERARSAACPA